MAARSCYLEIAGALAAHMEPTPGKCIAFCNCLRYSDRQFQCTSVCTRVLAVTPSGKPRTPITVFRLDRPGTLSRR